MQYTILIILLSCLHNTLSAQQAKYDYNWPLSYRTSDITDHPEYNGTLLNFQINPVKRSYFEIPFFLDASAAISDSLGHLLFYSNGCSIAHAEHKRMKNGDKINEGGQVYGQNCGATGFGYPNFQGLLILPFPNHSGQYIMLQVHRPDDDWHNKDLLYTVVDMAQDSSRGAVTLKNVLAYREDTLMDMLTAVRHANGRDWWVVVPKLLSREYLVSLVDNQGIHPPVVQTLPAVPMGGFAGQAVFSPNGKKYITMDAYGYLQVFDFDRCSGLLSHPRHVSFAGDTISAGGVAVSPSSRYLYISARTKLYQLDLAVADLTASSRFIAYWDGYTEDQVLAYTFFQQMLAPDGQIYMRSTNGTRALHVIHQPDRPGRDCDFEQRAMDLLTWNYSLPNFPHFRLFDVPGSPCDTLGINGPQPPEDTLVVIPPPSCADQIAIYPNPAALQATLEMPRCQAGTVTIYDVTGRRLQQHTWAEDTEQVPLDVSLFVPGLYLLRIQLANGERISRTMAVMR